MYPPARVLEAKIFGQVPEQLAGDGPDNDWIRGRSWGRPRAFLEAPAFSRSGELYCVDVTWGRIFHLDKSGNFDVAFQYDGEPNAMRFHRDGRVFIADAKRGILVLDLQSKKLETFCTRVVNEGLHGPNDLTFAANGDLFFTDMGRSDLIRPIGRVIHVKPDGSARTVIDHIPGPNGLVLSADESSLYLAVTRENAIWNVNLRPDRTAARAGIFINMSGGIGPDGITMDGADNLVVAHAGNASVWVFSPLGEPLYRIKSCTREVVTNVAYDVTGDSHMLYFTEALSAAIMTVRLPDPGRALYSHQA